MSRSKTVTFTGEAASAFVNAQMGKRPADNDEKLARIATFVFGYVKSGDMDTAKMLLKVLAQEGLDEACAVVTR